MSPQRFSRSAVSRALTCVTLFLVVLGLSSSATAELRPSTHLLVPYFEVDLENAGLGLTTLFAVVNSGHRTTSVRFRVFTNWGIPVLDLTQELCDGEVRSVNLRDWIAHGDLPDRKLSDDELAASGNVEVVALAFGVWRTNTGDVALDDVMVSDPTPGC